MGNSFGAHSYTFDGLAPSWSKVVAPPPAQTKELPLSVTLEELLAGTRRRVKVERRVDGRLAVREMMVRVRPGCEPGARIRFVGAGDQPHADRPAADVVFVVTPTAHRHYERRGADLHHVARITINEARCGTTLAIPTLGGGSAKLRMRRDTFDPRATYRLVGQGLPEAARPQPTRPEADDAARASMRRGDLYVTVDVVHGSRRIKHKLDARSLSNASPCGDGVH